MDTVAILERCDLSIPDTSKDQLYRLADLCTRVEFEPGTVIANQGDEARQLYIIEEGLVSIIVELGAGREQQIQTASRFDIFGWSAVVPPFHYTAKVKAVERTKALAIDREDLLKLCLKDPQLCYVAFTGVARTLAERLHSSFLQLIGIT